ncbi:MAG: hypothetical protein AAGA48_00425 [Myxococcota bacterium]
MVRWWMAGIALGCGGAAGPSANDTEPEGEPVDICEGVRMFDVASLSCDAMRGAYDGLLSSASNCVTDEDCQALRSGCEVLLINACYRAANTCIDQGDLQPIINAWGACRGGMEACPDCGTPRVFCDDGTCQVDES